MKLIFNKFQLLTLAILIIVTGVGCSTSGTSILLGDRTVYPATDPTTIQILIQPPAQPHIVFALVEGTAATDDYFTKKKTQEAALKALKEEAARIGANAIILTSKESSPYGQVITGNTVATSPGFATTTAVGFGFEKITLSGRAIRFKK